MSSPAMSSDLQVIFMDAGQGDCTLIVYPDNSLTLIDCGSTKSGEEAFGQIALVMATFLKNNNNVIKNLVLTHPDEDHYNKLRYLLTRSPWPTIDQIYYGGDKSLYSNKRKGEDNFTFNYLSNHPKCSPPGNAVNVNSDKNLSRAGVNVTILAANSTGKPDGKTGALKNTNSIVLMVEYGPAKLFLMGDAFMETEAVILEMLKVSGKLGIVNPAKGQETVLKMGHHGSDTSTGPDWVKAVAPGILVVSSGTKTFSRKGMPTIDKMRDTVAASAINQNTGFDQSYVVFDPTKQRGTNFLQMAKTTQGIWTTCYQVAWIGNDNRWRESGQTWYYGVTQGRKSSNRWYGYTGYEEDENVDGDT